MSPPIVCIFNPIYNPTSMAWQNLMPLSASTDATGQLVLGGCRVSDLAERFGTPLYVFDKETLHTQAERALAAFRSRWQDTAVLYATKAFFAPFLAQLYRDLGLGLDVTSEGELMIAASLQYEPAIIYVHGNNKTPAELRAALAMGVTHFVADNLDDIARLDALAGEFNVRPQILLRLSPNIDAHTHRYMTTGVADSKFGLGISNGKAEQAARAVLASRSLDLVGLHFHIGSQVFDTDALAGALNAVLAAGGDWHARFGFELRELNVGGGWGVAYNDSQTTLDVDAFAEQTVSALKAGLARYGLPDGFKLIVEPGRGLIARAGVALYSVGSVKQIPGVRNYLAVDGGMGDNVRPALYGAQYQAIRPDAPDAEPAVEYAIAGRYCEQGDLLIEHARLPETQAGDLLVIPAAGAYQLPMASNYNLIPRPAIVLVGDGEARLVRRRETIEDMLACDVMP